MHQGKLNIRHPISTSSGSRDSIFTIARVTSEGGRGGCFYGMFDLLGVLF